MNKKALIKEFNSRGFLTRYSGKSKELHVFHLEEVDGEPVWAQFRSIQLPYTADKIYG